MVRIQQRTIFTASSSMQICKPDVCSDCSWRKGVTQCHGSCPLPRADVMARRMPALPRPIAPQTRYMALITIFAPNRRLVRDRIVCKVIECPYQSLAQLNKLCRFPQDPLECFIKTSLPIHSKAPSNVASFSNLAYIEPSLVDWLPMPPRIQLRQWSLQSKTEDPFLRRSSPLLHHRTQS